MNVNDRIREAAKVGIKLKTIADKAEVSYYRIASVVNPDKYRSESTFDRFETERINKAIDEIKNAL